MVDNVIPIGCITRLERPADQVLDDAKGKMDGVVLLGFDKEGELYFGSTYADGGTVIWLIECAKKQLLEVGE